MLKPLLGGSGTASKDQLAWKIGMLLRVDSSHSAGIIIGQ
jgi:hypothetical protein